MPRPGLRAVPVALGSDWSPSGSRNLLAELKVARIVNRTLSPSPFTDRELVAMATRNPAKILGWENALGSLAAGHFADLLVVARHRRRPLRPPPDGDASATSRSSSSAAWRGSAGRA